MRHKNIVLVGVYACRYLGICRYMYVGMYVSLLLQSEAPLYGREHDCNKMLLPRYKSITRRPLSL